MSSDFHPIDWGLSPRASHVWVAPVCREQGQVVLRKTLRRGEEEHKFLRWKVLNIQETVSHHQQVNPEAGCGNAGGRQPLWVCYSQQTHRPFAFGEKQIKRYLQNRNLPYVKSEAKT